MVMFRFIIISLSSLESLKATSMLPSIRLIWYSFLACSAAVVGDVVGGAVGESVIDAKH